MPGRGTLPALIVAALLAATAFVTWLAYANERDDAEAVNVDLARQAALIARQEVTVVSSGLRGASGIVDKNGRINPDRFRSFARDVLARSPFVGISWAPSVPETGREAFERRLGERISPLSGEGTVPVLRERGAGYLPVELTYPDTLDRRRLLGFDILSEPTRATVAEAAIAAGEPRLTPPITLVQSQRRGTGLYDPVVVNVGGRPTAVGVMISSLPGGVIARQLATQLGLEGGVSIIDDGRVLAGTGDTDDTASTDITVLGRRWRVVVPNTQQTNLTPAIVFGASGFALSLVAAGLFLIASRRERDLQRRRHAAELRAARESLLTRITEVIEREIGVEERLVSLARTMVPAVGDICTAHEVTADGVVRRVGVAALDTSLEDLVRALPEPSATSPIRAAITSREPVLYTRVAEDREVRRAAERGIEVVRKGGGMSPAELLRADERSNLIIPLVARDRVLGTLSLTVLASTGREPLTREDVAFGMEVATHAAVALDNARLYEQQRDIAAILQQALLPRSLPDVEGADVAVRHRPGKAGTEVGGDFYDLFPVGDRWMAVVGDVCGKGPEAASLTALVRHTLRATAELGPEEAVQRVHDAIKASGENTYCTLCCAELVHRDSGSLGVRIATAGHPEPRVVSSDGRVERLNVTGPLVGVLEDPVFGAQEIDLAPGSMLFMCSDGLPEARRNGEIFGDARLETLLADLSGREPAEVLKALEDEVIAYVEGRQRDDLALFAIRVATDRLPGRRLG